MKHDEERRLNLGKHNILLLVISAVLLIVGYVIMATNEITVSAIHLAIVYVVIIPFALLWRKKER